MENNNRRRSRLALSYRMLKYCVENPQKTDLESWVMYGMHVFCEIDITLITANHRSDLLQLS